MDTAIPNGLECLEARQFQMSRNNLAPKAQQGFGSIAGKPETMVPGTDLN
jgi:hypothetical protein